MSHCNLLLSRQFQQCKKESDHFAARSSSKNLLHRHASTLTVRKAINQIRLMQTDRRVVIFNAMIPQARDVHRLHDPLERFDQIQNMRIFDFDGKFVFVGVGNHPAAMRTRNISARTFKSQSIERTCCGTELLICQKLLHEFEAWISSLALVFSSRINLRRCPRRKCSALDFDKRCRHHQKFSCKFNIDSVNVFQESEILLGDHRNRNVGDIDF